MPDVDASVAWRAACIEDAPALHDLITRSERHDRVPRVLELDELIDDLSGDAIDLAANSRVAIVDDVIVGVTYLIHRHATAGEQRCHISGVVDPVFRGQGIGRALVRFAKVRATEILAAIDDDLPKFIRIHDYEYVESTHRLAARMGFEPVRWFEELLRPLTDLPARTTIDGLRIEPWPADRDDDTRLTRNAAFADHWGSVPTTPEGWHGQIQGFGRRLDLSFIAVDPATDEVVALLVTGRYEADDALLGRKDGWIHTLGTLREWRAQGVGSALIIEALHAYRAAGLTHASIGVDADNPSGAARLYRSLGFEPVQREITHQITLS